MIDIINIIKTISDKNMLIIFLKKILIIFLGFIILWIIFVIIYRLIFGEWLKWVIDNE